MLYGHVAESVPSKSPATRGKSRDPLMELRAELRARGLRVTQPRLAVLRCLLQVRAPVSHGQVTEQLERDGYDRVTVYRNLVDLTEAGLVRRTDHGDRTWRFELIADKRAHIDEIHPHFVCDACGSVQCLPLDAVSVSFSSKSRMRFDAKKVQVQLRGRCDVCA
jgi:Fur family ferric uptake transcriptional regulator